MMVIKATTTGTAIRHLWPMDKCVWAEDSTYTGDGYRITSATFVDGGNAAPIVGVAAAQQHVLIEPQIGYIGKSGRFVGMSVAH